MDDHDVPELPEPIEKEIPGLPEKSRICPYCGQPARIVTNQYGTQAYCGPCHKDWPIANPGNYGTTAFLPPRGIHKITIVDYSTPTGDVWSDK